MSTYVRSDSCVLTDEGGSGGIGNNQLFIWHTKLADTLLHSIYVFSTGNVNTSEQTDDGIGEIQGYANFGSPPYFEFVARGKVYLSAAGGVLGLTCIGFVLDLPVPLFPYLGEFRFGLFLPDWWGPGLATDYAFMVVD